MKILITGGSGFIGTNYVQYALDKGCEILNIDIKPPANKEHNKFFIECDIMDYEKMLKIIKNFSPEYVVHLAAKTGAHSITNIKEFAPNIQGVQNLINVINEVTSIKRVIFTSTLLVCKMGYIPKCDTDYMPTTAYGKSKVEGEKIVRNLKDEKFIWTIIRPISVWGPWMNEPYLDFFNTVSKGWYFHIGNGHYRRSMGYVENIAHEIHSILNAPEQKVDKKTFYVGDLEPTDLYEFAEKVKNQLNAPRIKYIPLSIIKSVAKLGDLLKYFGWKNVPMSSFRLNNMRTEYIFDLSPIKDISGYLPYNMDMAIARTVDWYKNEKH